MILVNKKLNNQGFTLIEVLIYSAILAIVSLVILVFINQLFGVNESSRRTREATDNARRSLETISQEIKHAQSLYTPTSVLVTNPGQLSLETTRDLPADEDNTYVDFYVDNEQLFIKREGQTTQQITSEKVRVTNLTFANNNGASSIPAIRITITVEYRDTTSGPKNAVTLTSSATLRYYE